MGGGSSELRNLIDAVARLSLEVEGLCVRVGRLESGPCGTLSGLPCARGGGAPPVKGPVRVRGASAAGSREAPDATLSREGRDVAQPREARDVTRPRQGRDATRPAKRR